MPTLNESANATNSVAVEAAFTGDHPEPLIAVDKPWSELFLDARNAESQTAQDDSDDLEYEPTIDPDDDETADDIEAGDETDGEEEEGADGDEQPLKFTGDDARLGKRAQDRIRDLIQKNKELQNIAQWNPVVEQIKALGVSNPTELQEYLAQQAEAQRIEAENQQVAAYLNEQFSEGYIDENTRNLQWQVHLLNQQVQQAQMEQTRLMAQTQESKAISQYPVIAAQGQPMYQALRSQGIEPLKAAKVVHETLAATSGAAQTNAARELAKARKAPPVASGRKQGSGVTQMRPGQGGSRPSTTVDWKQGIKGSYSQLFGLKK